MMTMRALLLLFALSCACDGADGPAPTVSSAAPTGSSSAAPTGSSTTTTSAPKSESNERTNVVVIMIDSLRADRMPWSDYRHEVVPNIARFAESAVRYTRFHALSSYTAMTFGGFVAARYPSEVERSGYFFSNVPDEVLTFPEVLQQAGVHTMSAHAHWYFNKDKAGLHQGFDDWEIVAGLKKSNTTDQNITGPKHLALAEKQLAKAREPFFAWYHFLDPHDMYMGHPDTARFGRGAVGAYDGEVHFTDKQVGKLLAFIDAQPWGKRTAVIISADHGETFGEHNMYRHGFELWQELTHVPLIVRAPGTKPRAIDEPRSGIDLPATIMDLLAVKPDDSFAGESLLPEVRGGEAKRRAVVTDLPRTSDSDRRRALIWGNHKLIAHGDDGYFKLFDVVADPREQRDLVTKDKKLFDEMLERYRDVSKGIKDVCPKVRDKLKGKKKNKPC